MAELHIIGHISSAKYFKQTQLLCKWSFYAGNGWKVINGNKEGQTQESCDIYTNEPIWDHPIDLHYTTQTLQNSPKLLLQIYCRDSYGRILFTSYGVCNVPLSPGLHSIECHTWKPIGDWKDRLRDRFLGLTLQLKSPNVLVNTLDRFELLTESMDMRAPKILLAVGLFYFLRGYVVYTKKIEDIFTCTNDTECDELAASDESESYGENTVREEDSTQSDFSNATTESTNNVTSFPNIISTTEATKTQTTSNSPISPKITFHSNEIRSRTVHKVQTDVCECDLTTSSCNINCCCDKDCKEFHLTTFSRCDDHHAELYDSRYCYNRNFIQRNNTPFILEKLANNLFCILYDNLPPTYSVNNDLDIKDVEDLRKAIPSDKLDWKWQNQLHVPEYNISNSYQDGDTIWKLYKSYIKPLEFPQSGFTDLCSFKKSLKYLREWKDRCLQTNLTNANKYLFPAAFNNFTVITSPNLLNKTYFTSSEQICPRNVCLPLTSHYCQNSWKLCNKSSVPGFCTNRTCFNVVIGVKYLIIHNGSMGISSIDAYFHVGNVSRNFYQYFEAVYEWSGIDREKSFVLSGNPGYIFGKPLIIGTLKRNKTDNVENQYINFNKTDSFLTLPLAKKSGECDKFNRHIVLFGENVKLKCAVILYTSNFNTSSCIELQNRTMHFLMRNTLLNITQTKQYSTYISKTGNFTKNETTNWSQILLDRIPQNVITGQLINGHLHCSGLVTSMHVNIVYSTLPKPKTLTNHKIFGVGITFSEESDISWSKCLLQNCTDVLKLDVLTYVTFHDVSKPSKYYFVGGPNLDISLPHDFFYPFLSNSASTEQNILIISIITLSIICTTVSLTMH